MNIALSLHAMATRFELILEGEDGVALRAAGEEALREIERVDEQLSRYRADSEISMLNRHAAHRPVRVSPPLFRLLADCSRFSILTGGAFEVTVGPLVRLWRAAGQRAQLPTSEEIEAARAVTGCAHLNFDPENFTIGFDRPGVEIDLGGYGKGYAIERAVGILREYGVTKGLLHGGTSSVAVFGSTPWPIRLQDPLPPETIELHDQALSVSAIHGRKIQAGGREYGHVIDPATGQPVERALAAAAIGPSPSVCEVISTALLVRGAEWVAEANSVFQDYQVAIAIRGS